MSDGDRYVPGSVRTQPKDYGTSPDLVAALPHQCQQWEIGGREHVRRLIQDLEALLPLLCDELIVDP